ncbi:MAG: hemolysin family protein [Bdellovibrionia bacterium]
MEQTIQLGYNFAGLILSLLLVALNGFFVAAEFAIVKVRRTRLAELAGQNVHAARITLLMVDQIDEVLSATQLGITIVSLALGWIGEPAFANLLVQLFPHMFHTDGHGHHVLATIFAFFSITLLHVVVGEQVPKVMAIQNAEKVVLFLSKPLRWFYKVSYPLNWIFTKIASLILKVIGYDGWEEQPLTEHELKMVMTESKEEGVITENEAQIISKAFEFSDKRARDIMVHSDKVDYISLTRPFEQNMAVIMKNMHTRFPLCERDFDTVVGLVHMKDLWPHLLTSFSNEAFQKTARPVLIAEPTVRQDRLLRTFQTRRAHMAIVRDPQTKKSLGIVTMEDVLEELVGDIRDEHGG